LSTPQRETRRTPPRRPVAPARPRDPREGIPNSLVARAAKRASAGRRVQRVLDEDFEHGGVGTQEEIDACKEFARIVNGIVDQAHADLLAGKVAGWEGAKIGTFLNLLARDSRMAITHAANAIEERVYYQMRKASLPLKWVPQFDEAMGGASFPDIVIHLGKSKKRALIDITSDRRHILGKAGAWTTSVNYIYVAEAWFPPVLLEHMAAIKKNVEEGGVGPEQVKAMLENAEKERLAKQAAIEKRKRDARAIRNKYSSLAAFIRVEHGGNRTAAIKWLRANGIAGGKGAPSKPRKGIGIESKKMKRRQALKARQALLTVEEILAQKERRKRRAIELKEEREAAKMVEGEEEELEDDIVAEEEEEELPEEDDAVLVGGEESEEEMGGM
jgi:hypothetical protein